MEEPQWAELGGKRIRYGDHTWELTGDVDVRDTGELLEVRARQVDDVRHGTATLRFRLDDPPHSLNPGNPVGHFDRLEREGDRYYLIVKTDARTYRYVLGGIERE